MTKSRGIGRGGRRPNTGRKRAPNKASAAREAEVRSTGATPLDVMIFAMRYHAERAREQIAKGGRRGARLIQQELTRAADIAAKAASYVHPRFSSTTYEDAGKFDPTKLTDAELAKLRDLIAKSGGPAFAPRGDAGGAGPRDRAALN